MLTYEISVIIIGNAVMGHGEAFANKMCPATEEEHALAVKLDEALRKVIQGDCGPNDTYNEVVTVNPNATILPNRQTDIHP